MPAWCQSKCFSVISFLLLLIDLFSQKVVLNAVVDGKVPKMSVAASKDDDDDDDDIAKNRRRDQDRWTERLVEQLLAASSYTDDITAILSVFDFFLFKKKS